MNVRQMEGLGHDLLNCVWRWRRRPWGATIPTLCCLGGVSRLEPHIKHTHPEPLALFAHYNAISLTCAACIALWLNDTCSVCCSSGKP